MSEVFINHSDHDALEAFLERAERVMELDFFKNHKTISLSLSGGANQGVSMSPSLPSEESTLAAVSILRPFLLQDESIYYLAINKKLRNICKKINKEDWVSILQNHKDNFCSTLEHSEIRIVNNGAYQSPKAILDLYVYGKYAHHDIDKAKALKSMAAIEPFLRLQLANILYDLYAAIWHTSNLYFHLRRDYQLKISSQLIPIPQDKT